VKVIGTAAFIKRHAEIIQAAKASASSSTEREAAVQVAQVMQILGGLAEEPTEDSQTIRRVLVATHHAIWRVRPVSHSRDVQIRVLVWFRGGAVVALLLGNKALLQELWYSAAADQAERMVDQLQRIEATKERKEGDD